MVPRGGDVERELPAISVANLGSERVAHCLELGGGDESREDVELDELDLLLVGEGVERAGCQVAEGVVSGSEDREALVGAAELGVNLVGLLGALEQPD